VDKRNDANQGASTSILNGYYGGIPALIITTPFSKAAISLFGAHLLSFAPHGEPDWLWLSQRLAGLPTPIRGGIPICWPWFAKEGQLPEAPQHGYARTALWDIAEQRIDPRGAVRLVLKPLETLQPGLAVQLTVSISEMLQLSLLTANNGANNITFSQAFHTYLAVEDSRQCVIEGLNGLTYLDKLQNYAPQLQTGTFHSPPPFDRIYEQTQGSYQVLDRTSGRLRLMASSGSRTAVVWNPGPEGAAAMADVGEQWRQFICVEVANARQDCRTLRPGEAHTISMSMS
jgi:glucose-6-phosphate 1-epimerase